jgi:hypothetical protein
MRLVKTVIILALAAALTIGAYLYWLLMTPVNAGNVQVRLTSYCYLGTKALQINESSRVVLEKLKRGSCGCLSARLVSEAGSDAAAKVTEAARRLGVIGIKRNWSQGPKDAGGGIISGSGLKDRILQEFSERYVKAANACEAEPV